MWGVIPNKIFQVNQWQRNHLFVLGIQLRNYWFTIHQYPDIDYDTIMERNIDTNNPDDSKKIYTNAITEMGSYPYPY